MENRKLASIQVIRSVKPIEGADNIEVVRINNWDVVAKKGEFIAGDQCVYFEIDSFLPIREEFEFLRKTSYKKMLDVEGFRLKTIRLRKQLSQGLALPYSILGDHGWTSYEGMDVTQKLGVLKYEAPIPAELAGKAKGGFPSFIPKTDEERIQNLTEKFEEWKIQGLYFYESEKLDGTSATFYINDGEFGICSRNWELQETEGNSFWRVAREMKLEEIMRNWHDIKYPWQNNHSIQGELIGEGIQGNPYKIKGQTIRFFNLYNIDRGVKEAFPSFKKYMDLSELPTVPILDIMFELPDTIDELLQHVDGKSLLNSQANREGSVFRSMDGKISFKVISNRFLLKSKD